MNKDEAREAKLIIHGVPDEAYGSSPKEFWRDGFDAGYEFAVKAERKRIAEIITEILLENQVSKGVDRDVNALVVALGQNERR